MSNLIIKILTNKWFYIVTIAIAAIATILLQSAKIKSLSESERIYKNNTEVLLEESRQFKVRDSLSAVRVNELSLTLEEYKRYRAEDAALIADLKVKNKNLTSVNTIQSTTIAELKGRFVDSVVVIKHDTLLVEKVRAIHIQDPWITFDGVDRNGEFVGTVECRDSLLIASEVKYKRFFGFLWETSKVLNRTVNVVSKSPHTKYLNTEFIEVRK